MSALEVISFKGLLGNKWDDRKRNNKKFVKLRGGQKISNTWAWKIKGIDKLKNWYADRWGPGSVQHPRGQNEKHLSDQISYWIPSQYQFKECFGPSWQKKQLN